MKKFLFAFAAALVAFVACEKPEETKEDAINLASEAVVNVAAESEIVTIKFNANVAWTAELEEDVDWIVLNAKAGDAGDAEIKATVQSLPEDYIGRTGKVTIKAGTASAEVLINQGFIFYVTPDYITIGKDGGKVEFKVTANTEYNVTTYDSFDWAPVEFNKETGEGSFTVAKNEAYDLRSAYVKFTVPAIQVPVYDEETGEETGETEDYTYRLYVVQDGNSVQVLAKSLPADFDVANSDDPVHDATVSIAKFNGKYLVCDATKVYEVDPATGAFSPANIPSDLPVQSITNDDAGNLLFAPLIGYCEVGKIYAVKATDTAMANPVVLIPWVNEAWAGSRGADKVAAKGDVFGNGMVTMIYGGVGSYDGLTYCLAWEIKNGAADVFDYNEWNKSTHRINNDAWLTSPDLDDDLWLSNRAVFAPAGATAADGFFYCGYDGLYGLYYYNGTEWSEMIPELGNWAYAPNGLATTVWNGHSIIAITVMSYFPEWGIPSMLVIADLTSGELLSITEYANDAEEFVTGAQESSTTDVILEVEGDELCATLVDSAWGMLLKMKFPKL